MSCTYAAYKRPTSGQKTYKRLKVKAWKKNIPCKRTGKKKAGAAILIPDKTDFKTKAIITDKEGHYIILKGSVQQEDISL